MTLRLLLLLATLLLWSPTARAAESGPPIVPEGEVVAGLKLLLETLGRSNVLSIAWSPDNSLVAIGSLDGLVRLWDPNSGRELRRFGKRGDSSDPHSVTSIAWSPNGSQIATGSVDNTLKLWDAASGRELNSFEGHYSDITSI